MNDKLLLGLRALRTKNRWCFLAHEADPLAPTELSEWNSAPSDPEPPPRAPEGSFPRGCVHGSLNCQTCRWVGGVPEEFNSARRSWRL